MIVRVFSCVKMHTEFIEVAKRREWAGRPMQLCLLTSGYVRFCLCLLKTPFLLAWYLHDLSLDPWNITILSNRSQNIVSDLFFWKEYSQSGYLIILYLLFAKFTQTVNMCVHLRLWLLSRVWHIVPHHHRFFILHPVVTYCNTAYITFVNYVCIIKLLHNDIAISCMVIPGEVPPSDLEESFCIANCFAMMGKTIAKSWTYKNCITCIFFI